MSLESGIEKYLIHIKNEKIFNLDDLNQICKNQASSINLITIYRLLKEEFGDSENLSNWLISPHPEMSGKSPLELMKSGHDDIIKVRAYLEKVKSKKS